MRRHIILLIISVLFSCAPKNKKVLNKDTKDSLHITSKAVVAVPDALQPKKGKPLPSVTKFRVSDKVCAWGKVNGVVTGMYWDSADDRILVYTVYVPDETYTKGEEIPYYETVLTAGECN